MSRLKHLRTTVASLSAMNRSDVLLMVKSPRCLLLLCCLMVFLFLPAVSRSSSSFALFSSERQKCSSKFLTKYSPLEAAGQLKIWSNVDSLDSEAFQAVIGNGEMMMMGLDDGELPSVTILHEEHKFDLPIDLKLKPRVSGTVDVSSNAMVDYSTGILTKSICTQVQSHGCLHLTHKLLIHRSRPFLFIQTLRHTWTGYNLLDGTMDLHWHKPKAPFKEVTSTDKRFVLYSYKLRVKLYAGIAIERVPKTVELRDDEKTGFVGQRITLGTGSTIDDAIQSAMERMLSVIEVSTNRLIEEHEKAWADLLHTGIHLDPADPDPHHIIPTAAVVNSTVYSVLSTSPSALQIAAMEPKTARPTTPLLTPQYCYNGVATLHSKSLWKHIHSLDDAIALRDSWKLTLNNHGCSSLIKEGAEGVLQAIVLSFAGLQFTSEHLALGTDAEVLHNEIGLSNVRYRNSSLNINLVKEDQYNLPDIHVTSRPLTKFAQKLYACEAGCILHLDELTRQESKFPIFVTEPATPILYISHSKEHLELLQHTLHVRNKLSHAEHISNQSPGIPRSFWYIFGAFFIVFHVMLIRIALKEYWSWGNTPKQYSYRFRLQP